MRGYTEKKKGSSLSILTIAGVQPYQSEFTEEYMNPSQRDHFKRILEAWRDQLKIDIKESFLLHMHDKAENFPDPVDRAVQEEEFSFELRNRDREHKLMQKIEHTIKKLESNSFGFCESCHIEIGIRRLEARPTASLCIDCKTLDEIREKQTISAWI